MPAGTVGTREHHSLEPVALFGDGLRGITTLAERPCGIIGDRSSPTGSGRSGQLSSKQVAGAQGLEPWFHDPESCVLAAGRRPSNQTAPGNRRFRVYPVRSAGRNPFVRLLAQTGGAALTPRPADTPYHPIQSRSADRMRSMQRRPTSGGRSAPSSSGRSARDEPSKRPPPPSGLRRPCRPKGSRQSLRRRADQPMP